MSNVKTVLDYIPVNNRHISRVKDLKVIPGKK